ncbi:WD40 repeat domain-containing protein [Roseimaritima multifibrata]|nr:hypothetical protein [Roseimaritima multifibrata]
MIQSSLSKCLTVFLLCGWLATASTSALIAEDSTEAPADPAPEQAETSQWVTSVTSIGKTGDIAVATAQGLLLREGAVALGKSDASDRAVAYNQPASVWAVAASPDGSQLASTDYRGNLVIRNLKDSKDQVHEGAFERWTRALAFSPDGKQLIAGNEAGKVMIWDLEQKKISHSVELGPQAVMDLKLAPQGDHLAVADGSGKLHLLKFPSLESTAVQTVCEAALWCVDRSGDQWIVGTADNRVFRCPDGEGDSVEIAKMKDWVSDIAVSSSGLVAAAELNGQIHIMTADGTIVASPEAAPSGIWSLHWQNGSELLVGTRKNGLLSIRQSWDWTTPKAK